MCVLGCWVLRRCKQVACSLIPQYTFQQTYCFPINQKITFCIFHLMSLWYVGGSFLGHSCLYNCSPHESSSVSILLPENSILEMMSRSWWLPHFPHHAHCSCLCVLRSWAPPVPQTRDKVTCEMDSDSVPSNDIPRKDIKKESAWHTYMYNFRHCVCLNPYHSCTSVWASGQCK